MSNATSIFDPEIIRLRRNRAVLQHPHASFWNDLAADRLLEHLDDMRRTFPTTLVLGSGMEASLQGRYGITQRITLESSEALAERAGARHIREEEILPEGLPLCDAVLSHFRLHHLQDIPGLLAQVSCVLKEDGLFLGVCLGGESFTELRQALASAELEISGGISPRVAPFIEVRQAGMLLQRAGFALPIVDSVKLQLTYTDMFALMQDLRTEGLTNSLTQRSKSFTPRRLLLRAAEIYAERFPVPDAPERIAATIELLSWIGWKPAKTQPKPAPRGSGKVHLGSAFGVGIQ
jgi:NADH dehydrogenase [ubiquinone] 1 alpha subcomplex assembly factor 5